MMGTPVWPSRQYSRTGAASVVSGRRHAHDHVLGKIGRHPPQRGNEEVGIGHYDYRPTRVLPRNGGDGDPELRVNQAVHMAAREEGRVGDGPNGLGRHADAPDAKRLMHLAAKRICPNVTTNDDGDYRREASVCCAQGRILHAVRGPSSDRLQKLAYPP